MKRLTKKPQNLLPAFGFVADFVTLMQFFLSIIGTGLAVLGTTVSLSGGGAFSSIQLTQFPFALRLVLFVLLASALGWGLGMLCARLSASRQDVPQLIGFLLAFGWSCLLIGSADWMTNPAMVQVFPELVFFAFIGVSIVIFLMRFQFDATRSSFSVRILRARSNLILTFGLGALFMFIVTAYMGVS